MEWYKSQWEGMIQGERNGGTDAIAREEMIWQDGYVAYVNGRWWEREKTGFRAERKAQFQKAVAGR
jgi:hypothetical protein